MCLLLGGEARAKPPKDSLGMAALIEQIDFYGMHGQKDSTLFFCQKKAAMCRASGDLAEYIYTYYGDIGSYYCEDEPHCLLGFLETAVEGLWRRPETRSDTVQLVELYNRLGYLYSELGQDIPKALGCLEKSKALLAGIDIHEIGTGEVFFKSLGNAYTKLGDNQRAIAHFKSALKSPIFTPQQQAGNHLNLAIAYWNQGTIATSTLEINTALATPNLSRTIQAKLYNQLSINYLETNKLDESYRCAKHALGLAQPADSSLTASSTSVLARIQLAEGQLEAAESSIRGALGLAGGPSREQGKYFLTLAKVLSARGKLHAALFATNNSLTAVLPRFRPSGPLALPEEGSLTQENTLLEALDAKASILEHLYQREGLTAYGNAALACHRLADKVELMLKKSYLYDASVLALAASNKQRTERAIGLAANLAAKGDAGEYARLALKFSENRKALVLLEAARRNFYFSDAALTDPRFERLKALYRKKKFWESSIKGTNAQAQFNRVAKEMAILETELKSKYPNFGGDVGNLDSLATQAVGHGTLVISYFYGKENVYAIVCSKEAARLAALGHPKRISAFVRDFRHYFSNKHLIENDPRAFAASANALYNIIMNDDMKKAMATKEDLVIVADGPLQLVPFAALVTSTAHTKLSEMDYLLKTHIIRYAQSLSVVYEQRKHVSNNRLVLAIAPFATSGRRGLPPLAGTGPEAKALFTGRQLLGPMATKQQVSAAAAKARIIHFATHAEADPLGGDARIELWDAPLRLSDIYALALDADLVALSACQTNVGEIQESEGVASLAYAFAYAGARSLISSLWAVDDKATGSIFRHFYAANNGTKSAALRNAQLSVLDTKQQASPYYWAAFCYIGPEQRTFATPQKQWWAVAILLLAGLLLHLALRTKKGRALPPVP